MMGSLAVAVTATGIGVTTRGTWDAVPWRLLIISRRVIVVVVSAVASAAVVVVTVSYLVAVTVVKVVLPRVSVLHSLE